MDESVQILEETLRLKRGGGSGVLVLVVETSGSTPRKAGARMLVRPDGSILGSVGGGRVEADLIRQALELLPGSEPRTTVHTLTEEHGSVCGGTLRAYLEPLHPVPRLLLIGSGHIARAAAASIEAAGFAARLVDPGADPVELERRFSGALEEAVGEDLYVVIATRDHELDFAAARLALGVPARFVGMLGSRRKAERLQEYLAGEGFGEEERQRIVIPVGLEVGAETPGEIGISIAAQLVRERRARR